MTSITEQRSEKVRVGHLISLDAASAPFSSTVMKTLKYPLLALILPEAGYSKIMAPVLSGGLSNIDICRSMARSLVYNSTMNKGLGIKIDRIYYIGDNIRPRNAQLYMKKGIYWQAVKNIYILC